MSDPSATGVQGEPGAATIRVQDVSRWYGNVVAVNGISLEIGPGVTGLLGPNGAGKSTLLHMLAGFLRPSQGTITVLDGPAWENPSLYRRLGLVPEREAVYGGLTGRRFVELSARLHGLPDAAAAADRAIRIVELQDAAGRPTKGYSKGMRQRIKVAAALVHDPEVLLLDEPFNGADPRQRLHLMTLFRRLADEGRTIVFSSHILEEVERLADRVIVIVGGRLAASGDFREIRRLMVDRPHTFTLHTSDDRRLATALMADPSVLGVDLEDGRLTVRTAHLSAFARALPVVARGAAVSLLEVRPADESLEDVFSYLVAR